MTFKEILVSLPKHPGFDFPDDDAYNRAVKAYEDEMKDWAICHSLSTLFAAYNGHRGCGCCGEIDVCSALGEVLHNRINIASERGA